MLRVFMKILSHTGAKKKKKKKKKAQGDKIPHFYGSFSNELKAAEGLSSLSTIQMAAEILLLLTEATIGEKTKTGTHRRRPTYH